MRKFKGRVIAPGKWKGEAAVSKGGFNTLASFQKSALNSRCKKVIVSDQNTPTYSGRTSPARRFACR